MERIISCFVFTSFLFFAAAGPLDLSIREDYRMHPKPKESDCQRVKYSESENDASYWQNLGRERVKKMVQNKLNLNKAKNVILFLGDGMSITTLAASRIYMGQLNGQSGEEAELCFEKFPTVGLSKTYCVNTQVADSACSATAYLGGVKGNYGTIGVSGKVPLGSCEKMQNTSYHVHSLAKLFTDNGRSAGVITTTRVTHASPAGAYAHTADRDWESDTYIRNDNHNPLECRDIAHQLVHGDPGKYLKVILGGGRREFRSSNVTDEEGVKGRRSDGRDLIKEWKDQRINANCRKEYVWNRNQLLNVSKDTNYLLGLFDASHCQYHLEANPETEPTFEDMVEASIKVLSKDREGFFLFAEGGRIDHGHHSVYARIALDETVEFAKGIAKAVSMTNEKDTLIVVTSDHAHVMTMSGYPSRGNNILKAEDRNKASDGLRYLTLSYANGPGYRKEVNGSRVDVASQNMENSTFQYPSMVPLDTETHGGEDVGVFALGPWNHLFTGVYEQSSIPHLISYATCLNKRQSACSRN